MRARAWMLVAAGAAALAFVVALRSSLDQPPVRPLPIDEPELPVTPEPEPGGATTPIAVADPASTSPTTTLPDAHTALVGRVRGRADAQVPSARVQAWLDDGTELQPVGEIVCDPSGAYRLPLAGVDALAPQARALAYVVARASADGWQTQTQRRPVGQLVERASAPSGGDVVLDFRLERGRRVFGRVVDARGSSVARARVALCAPREGEDRALVAVAPEVSTSADGRFEIGFASAGTYSLFASANGIGTALLEALELAHDADRHLGEIPLAGGGELRGRVRDPSGAPVASLELCAVPEELARDPAAVARAALFAPRRERGDGLYTARATTDATGAFHVQGLRAGRYAFYCVSPTLALQPAAALFTTGESEATLTLDAHRLIVSVRDPSGRPLRGAIVTCARVEIAGDGSVEPQAQTNAAAAGRDALATFEVEPDTTYALIAQAPGSQRGEELCVVAPGERQRRVDLVLQPLGGNGWLRVNVLGARGEALTDLDVLLRTPVTGQELRDFGWLSTDADGWLPPIPAGEYGVEVALRASRKQPPMHFPVRTEELARVRANERSEIALRARAGGRLHLRIDVDRPIPLSKAELDRAQELSPDAVDEMRLAEHGAEATLFTAGSDAVRSLQFVRPAASVDDAHAVQSRLLPGTEALVDDLLEPGVYVLRVRAPRFRAVETPVEIVAGLQREVRVQLVPE
ncbi:MAG: carboxypeptidase-like regulatory domain-containing protein [Planctomycetota bacterium]